MPLSNSAVTKKNPQENSFLSVLAGTSKNVNENGNGTDIGNGSGDTAANNNVNVMVETSLEAAPPDATKLSSFVNGVNEAITPSKINRFE